MSLPTYLAFDHAADHGHICPECDGRWPCCVNTARCPEPETFACLDCRRSALPYVLCDVCELCLEPLDTAAALDTAAVHDDVRHAGQPTALVHPN